MTDYSELEKSRRIRPGRFSSKQISDCLALSRRDLKIAETILKENQDWAFNIEVLESNLVQSQQLNLLD